MGWENRGSALENWIKKEQKANYDLIKGEEISISIQLQ